MKELWWKLPFLRGLSPMGRGFLESVSVALFASLLAGYGINKFFSNSAEISEAFAQIGATLLVAYVLQAAWVIQSSPQRRGSDRENWVGMATGIGACALSGILVALALSSHTEPLSLLEGFGFAWVVISVMLLGIWIALQPWAMYHWTHAFNTEYPDE